MHAHRRSCGLPVCLLFCGASFLIAQQSSNDQSPGAAGEKATVTVTVTGHDHRSVSGLKAEDLTLYEDGQRLSISSIETADVPACVGIVVDESGSMRGKLAAIASAMGDFVRASNPGNRTFVVAFNDEGNIEEDFTADPALIEKAVVRGDPRGGTALYDAVMASADYLAKNKECKRRVLVVVSDGEDNDSRKTLETALAYLQRAGNPLVYAIGLPHPDRTISSHGRHALEEMAGRSGGAAFFADSFNDLHKAALKVADELKNQYAITYVTAHAKPGVPAIRVEARAPGQKNLAVRTNVAGTVDLSVLAAIARGPATSCISGSVVDESKKPVAGINVEAFPVFSPNSYPKDSYPSTTTDEQGRFKLSELEKGPYILYTKNESESYPSTRNSFYRLTAQPSTQAAEKCAKVVVRLDPKAARLRIHVVDAATGVPLPRFGVSFRNPSGAHLVVSNASQDQEVLVPAHTALTVSAWSFRYPRSQPMAVTTPGPDTTQDVTVQLSPRVATSADHDR